MRWEDERYIRLYTRDTVGWLLLSFEAQGLFGLILRKVDRAGLLPLQGQGERAVAVAIGHAHRWETIEPALGELLRDGCVQLRGDILVVPNFIQAQEAPASDAQRQRESRARARDKAAAEPLLASVTKRDVGSRNVPKPSQAVTPSRTVPTVPIHDRNGTDLELVPRDRDVSERAGASRSAPSHAAPSETPSKKPDPRHASLRVALVSAYEVSRAVKYAFDRGADPPAVTRLLGLSETDEVLRRWQLALRADPPFRCDTIAQLAAPRVWNHFAPGAGPVNGPRQVTVPAASAEEHAKDRRAPWEM